MNITLRRPDHFTNRARELIETYTRLRSQDYALDRILFLAAIKRDGQQEAAEYQQIRDIDTWYTGLYQMILVKTPS